MPHEEVKIEEEAIDVDASAGSVSLLEDAMNAFPTNQKAIYPVCSLHNIDVHVSIREQEFECVKALAASLNFVLSVPPFNICVFETTKNSTNTL